MKKVTGQIISRKREKIWGGKKTTFTVISDDHSVDANDMVVNLGENGTTVYMVALSCEVIGKYCLCLCRPSEAKDHRKLIDARN